MRETSSGMCYATAGASGGCAGPRASRFGVTFRFWVELGAWIVVCEVGSSGPGHIFGRAYGVQKKLPISLWQAVALCVRVLIQTKINDVNVVGAYCNISRVTEDKCAGNCHAVGSNVHQPYLCRYSYWAYMTRRFDAACVKKMKVVIMGGLQEE